MAKPNLSEQTYLWLDFFPALIIIFVPLIIMVIIQVIMCSFITGSDGALCGLKKIMQMIIKLAAVVFGPPEGVLRYEREPRTSIQHLDTKVLYIRQRKVPIKWVVYLGCYGVSFSLFAAFVFWDIFLLAESHDCDDTTIDCFLDKPIGNYSAGSPITDCGLFEDIGTNVTITCYTFTYSFGAGLGAVGGLVTMVRIVMKVISVGFITMYENASDRCGCCKFHFNCLILTHYSLSLLFPTVIPVVFIWRFIDFSSLSYASYAQVGLFISTLVIGFLFPWYKFAGEDNEDNSDVQPINTRNQDDTVYMYGTNR